MVDEEVEVAGGSGHEFLVEERFLYLSDVEPGPRGQTHGYRTAGQTLTASCSYPSRTRSTRAPRPSTSIPHAAERWQRYEHMTDGTTS